MIKNNKIEKKSKPAPNKEDMLSRRGFVQKAAKMTGIFATGIFSVQGLSSGTAIAGQRRKGKWQLDPVKLELRFDPKLCASCKYCEIACAQFHEGDANPVTHRNRHVTRPILEFMGVSALSANAPGYPQALVPVSFASLSDNDFCRQCQSPECMDACPENAIYIDEKTGARVVDTNMCTGAGDCVDACQFNMIKINPGTGLAFKCDLCGGDPQCAKWCPTGAITVKIL